MTTRTAPSTDGPLSREAVWETILFMRDQAKWTGNRFDIEIAGIKFSIQRRGRQILQGTRKLKLSDTYFTRGDHAWLVIVRGFNFQEMAVASKRTPMLTRIDREIRESRARECFKLAEIDFEGDRALFENNWE